MQHKWHKEIKAWADGAEIEAKHTLRNGTSGWNICEVPAWWENQWEFRIKPQPKEPQYLYVYESLYESFEEIAFGSSPIPKNLSWKTIGKIKLEVDDV